jgi:hypothetical protein
MVSKPPPQSTKTLPKGGILRKRETSSLARFDHSCIRNALLEIVKGTLKRGGGGGEGAYAKGILAVVEFLDFFKLGMIATGGRLSHQATCPLWNGFWLDGFLWVELGSVGITLADGLCDLGDKSLCLKASMTGEDGPCPFLNPGICLTTEKIYGKPQSG